MEIAKTVRFTTLAFSVVLFGACLPTEKSSDTPPTTSDEPLTYTKTVTIDRTIGTIADEHLDSIGLGWDLGLAINFDDYDLRNPGTYTLAFVNSDTLWQLYYLPGAKEEWAVVSNRLDSLQVLMDSLFLHGDDSAGLAASVLFQDTKSAFDSSFIRDRRDPVSACTFSANNMSTTGENNQDELIPLVVSLVVDGGVKILIDQQASKPSGVASFEFEGRAISGSLNITCPNPLN